MGGRAKHGRRRVAAGLVLTSWAVASVAFSPPASASTLVTIASPAEGAVIVRSATISGSASAPSGVAAVHVAALRTSDNQWLQPGGGFGSSPVFLPGALGSPGQRDTSWSAVLPLSSGPVLVLARATATDGTVEEASRSFRVATGPMLTLQLGRAMLAQGYQCQTLAGQPTIFDVATELRRRGMFAVGVVVPERTHDTEVRCENGNLYPSWADLARLRDEFGWSFVSNGQARRDLPRLSRREQVAESCGSLDSFAARGHHRAWGLFGPNSNQITDQIAIDVVNRCFAFARLYAGGVTEQQQLAPPFYERVRVAGGGTGGYDPPADILSRLDGLGDGDWLSLGSYKFVTGQQSGPGRQRWDCTAADAAAHWTTDDEVYCWQDYLAILDGLAQQGLEVVDPVTVAERWGRVPAVEIERFVAAPRPGGLLAVTFSAYESGDYWLVANGSCAAGPVVSGGTYVSASTASVSVPASSLPPGRVELQLCLRNGFGRIGSATTWVSGSS